MGPAPAVARGQQGLPRAPVSVPTFTCETTCCGLGLLFVELCVTAMFFSLYGVAHVHQGLYMTSGIISLISISSGFFGLCRTTPTLITSLIVSIATTLAFVLLGGVCIIFAFDVPTAVATHLNKSLTPTSEAANEKLIRNTKIYLGLAASALLTSALFHALLSHHLHKVVGPRRGAIAFLQTFSLIVLPFSLFLVIGGQYIVDSGTLASAPYTGIVVFGCGTLLLTIALLSFIGGTFEYRRLMSVCVLLSYATATMLVGLSIAYFALKGQVQTYIFAHWELLRVVLPPTFQARYDREQFVSLIQRNLQIVAYVGIVCGLFTFQNAGFCVSLMNLATAMKRQMAHDRQSMRKIESADTENSEASGAAPPPSTADEQVLQRHAWRQYFESSKRRQRIAMRIVVFLFVVGVALVFAVMCTNVVFATKCNSIGKLVQESNVTLFNGTTMPSTVSEVNVTNQFTRGTVSVVAASTPEGSVRLAQYGNAERNAKDPDSFLQTLNGSAMVLKTQPIAVTEFLWLDGSCQRSVLSIDLPTDTPRQLNVNSNASVDIRGGEYGPSLPARGLSVETGQANVNISQLLVLENGLSLVSASGEIELRDTTVDGRGHIDINTKARVFSGLGSVFVSNATFTDCDADIQAGAGTVELSEVTGTATTGRSRVLVGSSSGAAYVESVEANWVEIKSTSGDIYGTDIRTEGNSAFMGRLEVTSVSGDVVLRQIDPRGSVLVETASGNIKLELKTMAFAGLYYLRSESGNVTVRTGMYGTDVVKALADTANGQQKQGGINCDPTAASCLSYGDLHLRSQLGDIEVVLGCDTFQCV